MWARRRPDTVGTKRLRKLLPQVVSGPKDGLVHVRICRATCIDSLEVNPQSMATGQLKMYSTLACEEG